jgi:predicted nucleotidyltransferase
MAGTAESTKRQEYLDRIRTLVVDGLAETKAEIFLFGSYARGDATRLSDVDVAIDAAASLPAGCLARLREQLEESTIPLTVELVDLGEADAEFRARVRREGVKWNDCANG